MDVKHDRLLAYLKKRYVGTLHRERSPRENDIWVIGSIILIEGSTWKPPDYGGIVSPIVQLRLYVYNTNQGSVLHSVTLFCERMERMYSVYVDWNYVMI